MDATEVFDLGLRSDQQDLCDAARVLLERTCPTSVVRDSEQTGHAPAVWAQLRDLGLLDMTLPSEAGGGEAPLLDLALVCELIGAALAPVPVVEAAVGARVLSRIDNPAAAAALRRVLDSGDPVVLALRPPVAGTLTAVPSAAVAAGVLFLDADELRLVDGPFAGGARPNLGGLAIADVPTEASQFLARGPDAVGAVSRAISEWKVLIAAQLVGAGRRSLELAVDYVKTRNAFGVAVATFQAVAHRLADIATALDGARLLAREAAWSHGRLDQSPDAMSCMAYLFAAESAQQAATEALHLFGGYGFMLEYDIQLYFRRTKAWCLQMGDLGREAEVLADLLWSPAEEGTAL